MDTQTHTATDTFVNLLLRVRDGREITMIGGALAVDLVACPTCGSAKAVPCFGKPSEWPTNYVHNARRVAACERLIRASSHD